MNPVPIPSSLLSFFHTFNTLKHETRKLQNLIIIEAFEKLHKTFSKQKLKIKKICITKIKKYRRKPPKRQIQGIINLDIIIDTHNIGLFQECFWSFFYHMHKTKQHVNIKKLAIGNRESEKTRKDLRNRVALLKIIAVQNYRNNTRTKLMKYFHCWNYMYFYFYFFSSSFEFFPKITEISMIFQCYKFFFL